MDFFSAKFLFLAVVALVVLGPDKLPSALRSAGRLLAELRRVSAGLHEQSRSVMAEAGLAEPLEELRSAARSLRHPGFATVMGPGSATTATPVVPGGPAEAAPGASPQAAPGAAEPAAAGPRPTWP